MEVASGIVGSIVAEIAKRAFDAVFNGSLCRYNVNITGLGVQVDNLVAAKADLQNRIDVAVRKAEDVFLNVLKWMTDADAKISEANTFLTEIVDEEKKKCSCFNFIQRRRLSKKAKNMGIEITKLLELGKFDQVSCPAPLPPPIAKDYLSFESRETIMKDILEALQDPDIKMIGVYGMGGIGKTQLVINISNQVTQSKSFEHVLMATIGQIPDIKLIQGQLADMLPLKLDKETEQGRAALLLKRLQNEKKILIVLDDIWDSLDLDKVGIPSGDDNKGCKILVTSRYRQVLSQKMGIKKIFELKDLNEQESWRLFKITVDDKSIENDLEKMPIATEIVNKCGKLPLAIVIVAKALQGEPLYTWRDALRQLDDPANVDIEGVSEQVYTSLKWSYDRIKNPEDKSLFLLCSIFPDDHLIEIDELSTYAIGLKIIQGGDTLRTARDKILTMVDHLESSCLLQKCKLKWSDQLTVKMHDVVRDVAIYIASKDDQMCTLSYGKGLKKWQDEKLDGGYTAIRVDCAGFEDLPLELSFPKLELLALHYRYEEKNMLQIPEGYFGRMGKLKVLHLKRMRFTLPSSMDCLVNLQTLLLIDCHVENIDMIGKLKELEILDFSKSNITELPLSLSQLSGLKQLKVSNCRQLKVIQPGVISRMTKLEELFLDHTFNDWEVEESNNCEQKEAKTSISELGRLRYLTCLYICIPDVISLPEIQFLNNLELERFQIVIGKTKWDHYPESKKMLDIKTDSRNDVWKELQLLEKCEYLRLEGTCGVRSVVLKLKTSVHLKYLRLEDNEEVEYLVSELDDPNHDAFSILETIINEGYSFKTFEKLKTLEIWGCDKMKYLLSVAIVEGLSNLESIQIGHCEMMEAIVVVIENEAPVDQMEFRRLRKLKLHNLPELKSFCGKLVKAKRLIESQSSEIVEEDHQIQSSEIKITFPNLEWVIIWKVENVWHDLLIGNNIEKLSLHDCKEIESVFIVKNNETSEDVFRWVPKLESLDLWNLPNLKHVWNNNNIPITFQSLRYVGLNVCPKLKTVFPHSLTKHLQQLQYISIKECGIDEIFGTEESESNSKVSFPSLYSLEIENVNNLEIIWHNRLIVDDMSNLQSIKVDSCKSLKCIFTSNVMSALKRLYKLHIQNCESLEQVFEIHQMIKPKEHRQVASINLRELVLCNLPSLKHVWSNDPYEMYQFQDLNDVEVTKCPKLVTPFPPSIARDLRRQLQRLKVYDSVDVIFMKQEPSSAEGTICKDAFIGLKEMELHGKKVIRELCHPNHSRDLFPELKVLKLKDFPDSELAFHQLSHGLERLEVVEASLVEIFSYNNFLTDEENQNIRYSLPLKTLHLEELPNLLHIWKESSNTMQPLFDNLEVVEVENCGRLKTLVISSSFSFQNLKEVTIFKCHGLKTLFGLSVAKTLVCLKKVKLCECNSMNTVFTKRKDEKEEDEIVFSVLEVMELYDLPNLKIFQGAEWRIRFPKLKTIAIGKCCKMMIFSHGIVCAPLLKFITVGRLYSILMPNKKVWLGNINNTIWQLYGDNEEDYGDSIANLFKEEEAI